MKRYIRNAKKEAKQTPEYQALIEEIKANQQDAAKLRLAKYKLRQLYREFKAKGRKVKRKRNKVRVQNRIEYYAQRLEDNLPASERWFRDMYLKEDIQRSFSEDLFKDQFNKPFNQKYIPDVSNVGYKYIIEVDGSIHNTPEQQLKDIKKDYYFKKRDYLVIRVRYGSNADYHDCVEKVRTRVAEIDVIERKRRG